MRPDSDLGERFAPWARSLFGGRRRAAAARLPAAAEALLVWELSRALERTVVWIGDGAQSLETMHRDLSTLGPARPPAGPAAGGGPPPPAPLLYYPARDAFPGARAAEDPELSGYRLLALLRLAGPGAPGGEAFPQVLATSIQALLQKAPAPERLQARRLELEVGRPAGGPAAEGDTERLAEWLQAAGYTPTNEVLEKGETAARGGVVDVWPVTEDWPVRIEFVGATVESIRVFNPADQRSLRRIERLTLAAAREAAAGRAGGGDAASCLLAYLPADAVLVWSDAESVARHAAIFEESAVEAGAQASTLTLAALEALIEARPGLSELRLGPEEDAGASAGRPDIRPLGAAPAPGGDPLQPDFYEEWRRALLADLEARAGRGQAVAFYFDTDGARQHFREGLARAGAAPGAAARFDLRVGPLSAGFVSDALELAVVAEADLYGRRKASTRRYAPPAGAGPRPERVAGLRASDLAEMEPGDLVVHVDHGIGRYLGVREITVDGRPQEVLSLQYAEGAKLHVPVSQAHLLSRYVGLSRHRVELHRLGGKRWQREKGEAQAAVADLASNLLETQARRELLQGHPYPADPPWQHEFEASFPFQETPDQAEVIDVVKRDMQSPRPMDRLICGDAGYGKTEIAMRAAFKAVASGKQVAVLVPTTVLAQQHYETFCERMAGYPLRIEVLSRFRSPAQRAAVLRSLAEGTVDVVIGTHALLQPGVRFRDLGLAIVDEEQRFGVEHKERLKGLRQLVDVLTLTATPIPRTLYMSMTGARDMSLLQTPPRERMAIETQIVRNTDHEVREAILRELNREGQVFYLHNRVMTIEQVAERLQALVPEARFGIGHGQMPSAELARIMRRFAAGEFDVLVCTTIIESGLDIPRANTILIDRADRFGIADLYQLRGRVGRSNRKAYAYLLLPAHGQVDADARSRITALRMHSSLGAGFKLAMRDLEIRGAGNLLGAQQSGHITAVGFALYCQLLRRTVARLKGEKLPPVVETDLRLDFIRLSATAAEPGAAAHIPYTYVDNESLRVALYRRLAEAAAPAEIDRLAADWVDRFGPLPPPVLRLLAMARVRIAAAARGIRRVETREDRLMLERSDGFVMREGRFPRLAGTTPDEKLAEILKALAGKY